jgi:fumarate hydratase subunit beta
LRELQVSALRDTIATLLPDINYRIPPDVLAALREAAKGELHGDDMAVFTSHGAIYFAAIGGLGALLSKHITAASVVAYDDLGPEALYALELERFPAVVIIDREGRNFHEESRARWRRP